MKISVIIPNRDDPRVGDAISSLLSQEGASDIGEIIVVGSDASGAVPHEARVRFVTNEKAPPGANRNTGAAEARGSIFIFFDSDCVALPGWLRALQAALEQNSVVSGGVRLAGSGYRSTAYNIASFQEFHCAAPSGPRAYLPTLTLAVTRSAFESVGLFDESLPRCEDIDWSLRSSLAGCKPFFAPDAMVVHHPRADPGTFWRTWHRSGYYSAQVRRRHPNRDYSRRLSALLARPWLLRLLSPAVATVATAHIFRQRALWPYLQVAPVVWLTRLAWCWGAAQRSPIPKR